jgi:two-component system chemotaxis response regulator CheY
MAKILIVENSEPVRMLIKIILAEGGHEVIGEASGGSEAVEMYHLYKPDLVTMNITMPDMDGIEAVKQIKLKDLKAKFVMCSALEPLAVEAIEAGVNDFVVKPFDIDRFLAAVNKVLAG